MKLERVVQDSDMFRIFPYKNQVFFFTKPNGNFRSRLDIQTLQPIWTIETLNLKFNDSAFYEKYVIDENGLILDIPQKELYSLNKIINGYRWNDVKTQSYLLFGTLDEAGKKEVGVFNYEERQVLWRNPLPIINIGIVSNDFKSFFKAMVLSKNIVDGIMSINFLTGSFLWQRSFKELGIANLDKFIGDIDNVLICACGKTILGLDKNTGEELWRVNHYTEVTNAVLNQASGSIYLFYGWSGPENNFSENDNITFLEIEALTGEVLYDNSIFKHPNYIELNGLRHYEGSGDYPRFYNALQWKHKIYFIINSWHSSMVKIIEFDTVNKRISYLTEQSYEANANSNWFIAEGKLIIQSRISQQIESEENPDPLYWSKIYSKSQFDGEQMHYQHFAISKESYLTIFDLEDN